MKDAMKPTDKWCPMARLVMDFGPEVLANRFPSGTRYHDEWQAVRCLGTDCAVFVGEKTTGHCGLIRG